EFFRNLSHEEKAQLATEIKAFWAVIPRTTDTAATYVFHYFVEMPPEQRKAVIQFMNSLGDESPAEQKRLLDYLEYWNSDPRLAYRTGSSIFSVWFHVTDPTAMALVHTGVLVVILLFTLGLFTRVTSVLTWVACVSYIHRTQQVLFG